MTNDRSGVPNANIRNNVITIEAACDVYAYQILSNKLFQTQILIMGRYTYLGLYFQVTKNYFVFILLHNILMKNNIHIIVYYNSIIYHTVFTNKINSLFAFPTVHLY